MRQCNVIRVTGFFKHVNVSTIILSEKETPQLPVEFLTVGLSTDRI